MKTGQYLQCLNGAHPLKNILMQHKLMEIGDGLVALVASASKYVISLQMSTRTVVCTLPSSNCWEAAATTTWLLNQLEKTTSTTRGSRRYSYVQKWSCCVRRLWFITKANAFLWVCNLWTDISLSFFVLKRIVYLSETFFKCSYLCSFLDTLLFFCFVFFFCLFLKYINRKTNTKIVKTYLR